jgi:hypothetical protein
MSQDSEIVQCPNCGMTWFTRRLCDDCAFLHEPDPNCETCHGKVEYGLTDAHTCPEPFDFMTATMIANSGGIVDQRTAARVRLGLMRGPDA